jgi:hypothetical protein
MPLRVLLRGVRACCRDCLDCSEACARYHDEASRGI